MTGSWSPSRSRLSDQQWQVVLGALMGDGNLVARTRRRRTGARFRMGHGAKQAAYLDWKVSLLGNIPHSAYVQRQGRGLRRLHAAAPSWASCVRSVYFGDGKKHLSWDYLKALTPLALAVWYMDDGCFTVRSKGLQERTEGGTGRIEICVEAMSAGSRERLVDYLRDSHGLDVKVVPSRGAEDQASCSSPRRHRRSSSSSSRPTFTRRWSTSCCRGSAASVAVEPEFVEPSSRPVPARVLDIHVKPTTRSMNRFDIEVEGSHNYFVDGVMVHNSPETTTGWQGAEVLRLRPAGRAAHRDAQGRHRGGRQPHPRQGREEQDARRRSSRPSSTSSTASGISREGGLIDMGVEQGFVRKAGAWYTYEGDQLGQGKENARAFLKENPDIANEIEKKIKEKLGVGPRLDADATSPAEKPAMTPAEKPVSTKRGRNASKPGDA